MSSFTKIHQLLTTGLFLVVLTACNTEQTPKNSTKNADNTPKIITANPLPEDKNLKEAKENKPISIEPNKAENDRNVVTTPLNPIDKKLDPLKEKTTTDDNNLASKQSK